MMDMGTSKYASYTKCLVIFWHMPCGSGRGCEAKHEWRALVSVHGAVAYFSFQPSQLRTGNKDHFSQHILDYHSHSTYSTFRQMR
jgi:hypothetical protein